MRRYSAWALLRHALSRHRHWPEAWRNPEPRRAYDVILIGGGGHGLATAYHLARDHGVRNVAVLERSWIGSGNTGRNTTIIRSNYLLPENASFYDAALRMWESLSEELNFNCMVSQRGVLNLAHSDGQRDAFLRRGNAMRLNGIDAEWLDRDEVQRRLPMLDCSERARYPVVGGLLQPRGGTARHDAVAWGYARAADSLGVDVVQHCEVTGFLLDGPRVGGVQTTRGPIAAGRVGIAVAGHTSQVAALAGLRLPIESHLLQAFVSEPIKPFLDTVVTFGAGHLYISQSDKGELVLGGDLDFYNSYSQRGNLPALEHAVACALAMFPSLARLRMLRQWAGIADMTMDGSPIISPTDVEGLYLNGGWCYGGFKATPASGLVFAHLLARGEPHPLAEGFTLDRFRTGSVLDEKGAGAHPWEH